MQQIQIYDTTLRDGAQGPGVKFSSDDQLRVVLALDALGIPRAMATSTGRERATALLERAGLAGRFHAIVCGDDITRGKPAPDIFLVAARRLDAPSTSCLVLEDSEPGVRAAHAAHMKAVLVPDLAPVAPAARGLAWRIVANLEEVIPLLSQC